MFFLTNQINVRKKIKLINNKSTVIRYNIYQMLFFRLVFLIIARLSDIKLGLIIYASTNGGFCIKNQINW